jgi:hypothetical protein
MKRVRIGQTAVADPLARAEDWLYESPNDPFDRQEAL